MAILSRLPTHDQTNNLFLPPGHLMHATDHHAERTRAFQASHDVCGLTLAAWCEPALFSTKLVQSSALP
ncbi:hypothetical protein N825_21640 [Skermanella stibiiresistens SB22]|uniref:Uncharacterized protein n=1 Tax=Skermanella stibiiresistens SB22 TaxID=1385369 RepID=W9GWN1_9PROT|nr:hypothetical protein [Skermanella stibiiresistens]EWY37051.1 hypothetical protein N825_21640 [Skermanella stibiiresistens SB22]